MRKDVIGLWSRASFQNCNNTSLATPVWRCNICFPPSLYVELYSSVKTMLVRSNLKTYFFTAIFFFIFCQIICHHFQKMYQSFWYLLLDAHSPLLTLFSWNVRAVSRGHNENTPAIISGVQWQLHSINAHKEVMIFLALPVSGGFWHFPASLLSEFTLFWTRKSLSLNYSN